MLYHSIREIIKVIEKDDNRIQLLKELFSAICIKYRYIFERHNEINYIDDRENYLKCRAAFNKHKARLRKKLQNQQNQQQQQQPQQQQQQQQSFSSRFILDHPTGTHYHTTIFMFPSTYFLHNTSNT
mmetsp:Transcript_12546/g.14152  ORF Transcript_12546/g.14152 Transcript_12546/m.14152 type:complete len:127 (+) Transcript_12546:212-592(+)